MKNITVEELKTTKKVLKAIIEEDNKLCTLDLLLHEVRFIYEIISSNEWISPFWAF